MTLILNLKNGNVPREFKQKLLDEEKEKNIRKETPEEFFARVGRLCNSSQIVKANLVLSRSVFSVISVTKWVRDSRKDKDRKYLNRHSSLKTFP